MLVCPSCGSGLRLDPKTQKLQCDYCRSSFNVDEVKDTALREAKGGKGVSFTSKEEPDVEIKNEQKTEEKRDVYEATVYRCSQCGAELITTDETIATFCSYCGSSSIIERKNVQKETPHYVIPFSKTKEECEQAYKKKLSRAFFAPSEMKKTQQVEKIRGIYMPYWVYSFERRRKKLC